ncbi:branched-chain amino acid ABC transporter permease [Clostridium sp. AN503]|uniref:branched-chain amino acid ABC transporter permease n=1 Tax=Clostridium sp. AN503 TaxID=3160598 RepID=UPI00345A6176
MADRQNEKHSYLYQFEYFMVKNRKFLLIALALIVCLLPKLNNNQYFLTVLVKMAVYAMFGLGLNILTGYTGLVSLGHAGFVAVGAYTASLCAVKLGWGFFPSFLLGMLVAGVVGILLGLPTLRLTGTYLSIVTLGFGEIIKMITMNWSSVTNGTLGVKNIPKPELFGIKLTIANHGLYYLVAVMLLVCTLFCIVLVKSRTGRALQAIKGDELASVMMGINTTYYKILAFVISACICAAAGALYATLIGYIDPNTFNFDVSTMILSIVILGGMGTIRGMFLGAVILIGLPEVSRFLMSYRFVLYGVILVVMMRFRPQGLLGWKSQMPYKLSRNVEMQLKTMSTEEAGING